MIWHTKVCVLHLNTDINRSSKSSFTRLDSTRLKLPLANIASTQRGEGDGKGVEGTELWQQFLNALITLAPLETKTIRVALWVVHNRVLSPRFIMNSQSRSTSSACTQSALKNKLYLIVCYVHVCVCVFMAVYVRTIDCSTIAFLSAWQFSMSIDCAGKFNSQVEQGRRRTKARQLIYGIAINYCRTLSAWAAEGGDRKEEERAALESAWHGHNNWTTWRMRNKAREAPDKCAYTSENSSRRGERGRGGREGSYCGCTCCQLLLTVGKNNANLFYSTPI